MKKWTKGQIIDNKQWTEQLYSLKVEATVEPFQAGQFTKLSLDCENKALSRAYSYVNAPHDKLLEFYFNIVPEGHLSQLLSRLKKGDPIWVSPQSLGFLTLSEVPKSEHLWLIATGTGIGPFLSILKTEEPWQRFSKIILIHGVRRVEELNYQETIQEFKEREPTKFITVSSVTQQETDFALKDRIPNAIKNGKLEKKVGLTLSPEHSQVMLCGNSFMLHDTQEVLKSRGLIKNRRKTPGHITVEKYF